MEHSPNDPFLRKVLDGVMRVARDDQNPIRGNLAASGLRELVGHVLHGLAPDKEVRDCVWFKQAADTKKVTRRQRATYIVQAGLPKRFVGCTLKIDVRQSVQPLLEAMDALNRGTHVRPETIMNEGREVRAMTAEVLSGLQTLQESAVASRERTKQVVAEVMQHAVFERLISEAIADLDELSTHTIVDDHYIDTVEVEQMDATTISYTIQGRVEVELQYGSNSDVRRDMGLRLNASCPYGATVSSNVAEPMDIRSGDVDLAVDTRSFHG